MNTLLRKEFRLLMPAWIAALVAATMPLWFQWNDEVFALTFSCLAIMFLALAPFGQEMSCGTFGLLLVQPAQRRHFWRVKVGLLALTLLSAWALFAVCLWIRQQERPPHFASPGDFENMLGCSALAALVAFSGGLWSTLLLRDVTTAFFATLMTPAALCMATVIALAHWINNDAVISAGIIAVLAAYSVAGYLVARRLFLRAEDVPLAWTGAQISLPKVRGLSLRWLPRGFAKRRGPWSALIYKELQLQEAAMVFVPIFALLHLASLAVRYFAPAWAAKADHFSFLPFFWLAVPVVAGCAAVAEERRQNTLEGLLCLPVRKRHQFAVKFVVALAMGTVLGGVVPWGLDALADAMNVPRGYTFMHYQAAVAAAATVVSFYASTLSRSVIQALTTLVCLLALCGLAGALAEAVGGHFQYEGVIVNGGLLFPALALPALLGTLRWLSFRNYISLQTGWRLWLGNLARAIAVFAVVWLAAGAIFNRCWEYFIPLEPPHGPARLSGPGRAMIANSRRRGTCVLLPDGRLWAGGLDRAWENFSGHFAAGSNWVVSGGANRMQNGRLTMDRAFWLEAA